MTGPIASPTVRMAAPGVLAAEARLVPHLGALIRLAEWARDRRVTRQGSLTLTEARRAVTALHLPGDQGPDVAPARSAEDFEELDEMWWLAVDAELLDVGGTRATAGPLLLRFREQTDAAVLDAWSIVFMTMVEPLLADPEAEIRLGAVMRLYIDPAPVPMTELVMHATMTTDLAAVPANAEPATRELVDLLLPIGAAHEEGGMIRLSPLGVYGVNQVLQLIGLDAPTVTDMAAASAAEMFDLAVTRRGDEAVLATFDEWVGARTPTAAAQELVEHAAAGGARERSRAFGMLARLGREAEAAVRALVDEPGIGAYAASLLGDRGRGPGVSRLQGQWLLVDTLIASRDEHPELVAQLVADLADEAVPEGSDLVGLITESAHEERADALALLAEHYPDTTVARAARKAAMSIRSEPNAAGDPPDTADRAGGETYQLKVTLKRMKPPIWRRIQVPDTINLSDLHRVIQAAMGWTDSHLHVFEVGDLRVGVPDPDDWEPVVDERTLRIPEVLDEGERMTYTYDFGDDWEHDVLVEKVIAAEPGVRLPRCVTGRRACPPEDIGGPWGHPEFLAALGDRSHPDHELMAGIVGPAFDPAHFDADQVNDALRGR